MSPAGGSNTSATNTDSAKADNAAATGQRTPTATGSAPYQGLPGINADGTPAPLREVPPANAQQ
jgi:hypothetical protein